MSTSIIQALPDVVLVIDAEATVLDSLGGRSFSLDLGPDLIVGKPVEQALPEEVARCIRGGIKRTLKTRAAFSRVVGVDGANIEVRMSPHGRQRVLAVIRDMTDHVRDEMELQHFSRTDSVTGMLSREVFLTYFENAVADARLAERGIALLYFSLDQFRTIRDSLDEHFGDKILRQVAERMDETLRHSDRVHVLPGNEKSLPAARIGDGEFGIILHGIDQRSAAQIVVDRLLSVFNTPLDIDDRQFTLQPCMGLAVCPQDGEDAKTLLKNAMTAMYEARKLERSNVEFYSDTIKVRSMKRLDLERELHWAIEENQLQLAYQPVFELGGANPVSVEAFLRWEHPLRGTIRPDEFLPLAEAGGLLNQIGEFVLNRACNDMATLHKETGEQTRVAINLARHFFARPDLCEVIGNALEQAGIEPACLQLDLTERMLMRPNEAGPALTSLKAMGIGLQIDDFGCGFTSLRQLKALPIDALKIDASFVHGIGSSSDAEAICSGIISLAHSFGLRCIAESVESQVQLRFLKAAKCDEVQGKMFCAEMDIQTLAEFLLGFRAEHAELRSQPA